MLPPTTRSDDLKRICGALEKAGSILEGFAADDFKVRHKSGGSPVTEADLTVDRMLRKFLPRDGEGWLSEETASTGDRLSNKRVWIVDPLDGTKEFIARIPEWCVSIGLVEEGEAVVGGIYNPATREMVVGAVGMGIFLNGRPAAMSTASRLNGGTVLASRSECARGEWERFRGSSFHIKAIGSVAYKMALVATGFAEATWTLVPKHEWDVAAGTALMRAAGGEVWTLSWKPPRFNQGNTLLSGLVACTPKVAGDVRQILVL